MMNRRISILLSLLLITVFSSQGKSREIPDSLEYLFHDNFYFRYSQGFNIYLKDASDGYKGYSNKEIKFGKLIEPEIGTFIKTFMQIGVSYLYLDGKSEKHSEMYDEYEYDDVFFSGLSLKLRYFLINHKHLKVPLGIDGIWGNCYLNSGGTDDKEQRRGIFNGEAAVYYKSKGFGGEVSGGFAWYPFWFLSVGADAGLRILISRELKKLDDYSFDQNNDGENKKLNFSSIFLKGWLSLQF